MDLLHSGLKSLRCSHYMVLDMVSEFFLSNDEDGQRYLGLDNMANTCNFNSIVQALFFCTPSEVSCSNIMVMQEVVMRIILY